MGRYTCHTVGNGCHIETDDGLHQQGALTTAILCRWPGQRAQRLLSPSAISNSKGLLTGGHPGSRSAGAPLQAAQPCPRNPCCLQTTLSVASSPQRPSVSSLHPSRCVMTLCQAAAQPSKACLMWVSPAQHLSIAPAQGPPHRQQTWPMLVVLFTTHSALWMWQLRMSMLWMGWDLPGSG